ncbi:MAG: hypothetical protein LRY46_01035 [Candidatus Pacebacteria bacterium]|nr:hypothetical protein [Candidatus Paceibacterota bacterium]
MSAKTQRIKTKGEYILHWFEITLGALALIAVAVVTVFQIIHLAQADWSQMDIFYGKPQNYSPTRYWG